MTLYEKLCKKAGEVWYNFVKKKKKHLPFQVVLKWDAHHRSFQKT